MAEIKTDQVKPEAKDMKELGEQTEKILTDIKTSMEEKFKTYGDDFVKSSEYKTFMEKVTERLDAMDEIEKKMKRVALQASGETDNEDVANELKAIDSWMRTGKALPDATLTEVKTLSHDKGPTELKIASVHNDPWAGYLKKPATYFPGIIKHVTEFSPVRQYANVISSDGDVKVRRRTSASTAYTRMEAGTLTETNPEYGMHTITPFEITAYFKAYHWMIEDSAYPIATIAQAEAGEAMAYKEGDQFLNGVGVGEAEGIMVAVAAGDISHRSQLEATTLTNFHALRKIPYDINDQYTQSGECIYMMRRATLGTLVSLPDATGRYLLGDITEPGIRRIEGYKIVTAPGMAAIGAGAFPVVFGNFRLGYWILDRLNMVMVYDPFSHNEDGYVQISFRKRTGALPVQPYAFYALEISAA